MSSRTRDGRMAVWLGSLLSLLWVGWGAGQETRPASIPAESLGRLKAELRGLPPGPDAAREREKLLRKWFLPREPERHQALQALLREDKDRESLAILLGFLGSDLPALLAEGRAATPEGKLFLGYLEPVLGLVGEAELGRPALQTLGAFPGTWLREQLQRILEAADHPLLKPALIAGASCQDLRLAPALARWLDAPALASLARDSLLALTFRHFPGQAEFQAWWPEAKDLTWNELRDRFLAESLAAERERDRRLAESQRRADEEAERFFSPLVQDLVALRVRLGSQSWVQPLQLLREPRTRASALAGIVAALREDPRLMEVPPGELEKPFEQALELILELAADPTMELNGDLLRVVSFFSRLPASRAPLASRALQCLREKARGGREEHRLLALELLSAFPGWEADRALLDILCDPRTSPPVLFKVLDSLKGRVLDEGVTPEQLGAALGPARDRIRALLADGDPARRVRSDAILVLARWPSVLALPLLRDILLGYQGQGQRIEDRITATDSLMTLVQRQKRSPGLPEKVVEILQTGLLQSDQGGGMSLARVRVACAEKLGSEDFEGPAMPMVVDGLGKALVVEKDPETIEALVTTCRKIGLRAAKDPNGPLLGRVLALLIRRADGLGQGAVSPKERDWLFQALVELAGKVPASQIEAARAFARAGDREHALFFFESLTAQALPPGALGSDPQKALAEEASLFLQHLAVLLTGRLAADRPAASLPLLGDLQEKELQEAWRLLTQLRELRLRGAGLGNGLMELPWEAQVAWALALAEREAGRPAGHLFLEAARAMGRVLEQKLLEPGERLSWRLRLAEAQLEAASLQADLQLQAEAAVRALVQEEAGFLPARRLLARILERREQWEPAAEQWELVAGGEGQGTLEEWEARVGSWECLLRAGQQAAARERWAAHRPRFAAGQGPRWAVLVRRLEEVESRLQAAPAGAGGGTGRTRGGAGTAG